MKRDPEFITQTTLNVNNCLIASVRVPVQMTIGKIINKCQAQGMSLDCDRFRSDLSYICDTYPRLTHVNVPVRSQDLDESQTVEFDTLSALVAYYSELVILNQNHNDPKIFEILEHVSELHRLIKNEYFNDYR